MQLECEACHSPLRAEDVRFGLSEDAPVDGELATREQAG
jgi:hypothetical protein